MAQILHDWDQSLAPQSASFAKRGLANKSPASLTGLVQTGQIDSGHWQATLNGVPVSQADGIKAFRALAGTLAGGAGIMRVPVFDKEQRPFPLVGGVPVGEAATTEFTDGSRFTDTTGFKELAVGIAMAVGASRGATKIDVTIATAGTIRGGEYFSIGERLYIIRQVISVSGADQSWWIWPRLRQAVVAATALNFDAPTCLMRLQAESADDLRTQWGIWAFANLSFVEAFTNEDI